MNGKQLKNSILQWAIQGKLVPQDPNDEPASVLLERIRAEKARLVKEGKIKKDKNESVIYRGEDNSHYEKFSDGRVVCIEDEIPFEVPAGWEWARMSSLSSVIHYGFTASAGLSGNAKLLRITDIQDGKVQWDDVPFCEIDKKGLCNYQLENDDIVIARTGGTVGKSFVISNISVVAVFASYLIRIKPVPGLYIPYIATYLESPCYWRQLTDATSGTGQPNVNGQSLSNLLVPIPPFDEQMRIVVERNNIYSHLQKYTTAQDRIDALNESLREILKKSVLQEAIHGRLVPQDPREEPASVLLEQIREEKRKLLKEGKLKKKDLVDSIIIKGEDNKYYEKIGNKCLDINEEVPFDIPESWVWVRLASIANLYTGNSISETEKRVRYTNVAGKKYIGTKDVGFDHSINYDNGVAIPAKYLPDFRIAPSGSVLMCIEGGSAGRKIAILEKDVCFGNKLCCFAPYAEIAQYIYYYLQSPTFFDVFQRNKTGIIGGVSVNTLKDLLIALPPKDEQIRIVAKIQSLKL